MSLISPDSRQENKCGSVVDDTKGHREKAGPAFFAKRSVSDLQHWSEDRLKQLGPVPFPFAYCQASDRYEAKVLGDVIWQVAKAIDRSGVVSIVGPRSLSSELESLQILFHHQTGKAVELFQYDEVLGSGYMWMRTCEGQIATATGADRVVIALGLLSTGEVHEELTGCTTLFIHEHLVPSMFERIGPAFIVPMSPGGWKLSHIGYRRLLEIEAQQFSEKKLRYPQDGVETFARSLFQILHELLTTMRSMRTSHSND